MRCNEYGCEVSAERFENCKPFYSGEFEVISSTEKAIIVKKKYAASCPDCNPGYIKRGKLELVPVDTLEATDEL